MKLGRFDNRVLAYVAAFTFGNPKRQSQKQKTAYRKGCVRAAGTWTQQSRRNNQRS